MSSYRDTARLDTLILHCAATPDGEWWTAADIDRWHADRGFRRSDKLIGAHAPHLLHIGYHFVILTTGAVECGRALRETGAHARGHNRHSIGTCLIGTERFTRRQWESLAAHVRSLARRFEGLKIIGHRDVNRDKTCPGFDVAAWLATDLAIPAEALLDG